MKRSIMDLPMIRSFSVFILFLTLGYGITRTKVFIAYYTKRPLNNEPSLTFVITSFKSFSDIPSMSRQEGSNVGVKSRSVALII